jgi:glycosyltransferase involved in cell wall biosynthesis
MKVSILTATKERVDFLRNAYASLAAQSFKDWEWIVVSDGAHSSTHQYLTNLAKDEPRLIFQSVYPMGVSKAYSRALSYAKGEWIGFLDDDDYLHPDCLEQCLKVIEKQDVGMVYTSYFEDYSGYLVKGRRCEIPYSKEALLLDQMTFHFRFIKRETLLRVGGIDCEYPVAWDYDMCLRLSEQTEIVHLDKYLYHYRIHPNQISQASRIDQVWWSYQAMTAAMKRRGLDKQFTLTIKPRFKLEPIGE